MPRIVNNLMKQAQRNSVRWEENQKELETKEFSAKAVSGAVEVTVDRKKKSKRLSCPRMVDPENIEMLRILVMAAQMRLGVWQRRRMPSYE